jgi:hypothetical protein
LGDAYLVIRNTAICDNIGGFSPDHNEIFIAGDEGKDSDLIYLNSFVKGIDLPGSLPGNTDPMFLSPADALNAPTLGQWFDYTPKIGSPLINKGDNSVVTLSKDLNGNARIYDGTVDIGAYESQSIDPPKFNENIESKAIWAYQNRLFVRVNTPASLRIFSTNAVLVKQMNHLEVGIHEIPLPQGIYIVELEGIREKIIIR